MIKMNMNNVILAGKKIAINAKKVFLENIGYLRVSRAPWKNDRSDKIN